MPPTETSAGTAANGLQAQLFTAPPLEGMAGGAKASAQDAQGWHYVSRVLKDTEHERYTVAAMLDEAGHGKAFPRPYNPDADELRQLQNEIRAAAKAAQKKQEEKQKFEAFVAGLDGFAREALLDSGIGEELRDAGYSYQLTTIEKPLGHVYRGEFIQSGVQREVHARLKHPAPKKKKKRAELSLCERAQKIGGCGNNAVIFKVKGDSAQHLPGRCRDRLCPSCWQIDGGRLALALESVLHDERAGGGRLGFLTLTIAHKASDPLRRVARKFRRAWALFIRRKFWSGCVANYFRTIEVELTPNGWHFHAHILCSIDTAALFKKLGGKKKTRVFEWPNDELEKMFQQQWLECTAKIGRPSPVVRWQKVHGNEHKIISELCKYVTKKWGEGEKAGQTGFYAFTPQQVAELAHGIRNVKLHQHSDGWVRLIHALEEADEAEFLAEQQAEGEEAARVYTWFQVKHNEAQRLLGFMNEADAGAWERDRALILQCLKREGFKAQANILEHGPPPDAGPPDVAMEWQP